MYKKIYDSIHRFIHIDSLENQLIHTRPFQRLHYIHQLGVTFFVYPGSTHRRFEHSLGVMELATSIYDQITKEEKREALTSDFQKTIREIVPHIGSFDYHYWRRILRLAALCHDLGHLPFSHAAERKLLGEGGHEKWTDKIINSPYLESIWKTLDLECEEKGYPRNIKKDVLKISLGEKYYFKFYSQTPSFTTWEKIVSSIITGDFFGADRMDYLLRDAQCSGLVYGLFDYHQLIEMLIILPSIYKGDELVLGVEENGVESCETLLLARYYMHKRLYQYPTVKSYSFHMGRFMDTVFKSALQNLEEYISLTDNEILTELNRASKDPFHPGHFDAKCLFLRQKRFSAIYFDRAEELPFFKNLQKKLGIPDTEISWDLTEKETGPLGLTFPLLKQDGSIVVGDTFSKIFIPLEKRNWVFIAPEYEQKVRKILISEEII